VKEYECAVIFSPTVGSDVLKTSTEKYTNVIASNGGAVTKVDDWGKRTLAYEINFHREGYYHFYHFTGTGQTINELNRQLRIDENVIRHMIVRDEKKAPVPYTARVERPSDSGESERED
jgi:small subunit ribosomal protein S6